jgi:hypothetical protein
VRSFSIFLIVGSLVFFSACSNNGTPAGVPITVVVSASPNSLNPGQSSTVTASVTNTSNTAVTWSITSPASFGTLSSTTANPTTYTAPAKVSTTTSVTITATSAASSAATASVQIVVNSSAGTISLSPGAPQTLNVGETLPVTATLNNTGSSSVTWSLLTGSVGSLSSTSTNPTTYVAPATGTGTATLQATSGAATQTLEITVLASGAGPNVAGLTVGTGPVPYVNGVLTSVQICQPGSTTNCQTVDGILVDTGSYGLRILGSEIPNIALTPVTYTDGSQMNECVAFLDGSFLWGGVSAADIRIGGEVASGVPVQVIANPTTYTIPTSCSNGGMNEDTQSSLAANGILGVGAEPFDCGPICDVNGGQTEPIPGTYYADCNSASGCQPVFASCGADCSDSTPLQQVTNPVVTFTTDNQGTVISMSTPAGGAAPTASGTLTFGIGSESNNALSATTILEMSSYVDEFETSGGPFPAPLLASFIDSGSNGLFFPNWPNYPLCTSSADFFCPSSNASLTVTNLSEVTGGGSGTANVSVDNWNTQLGSNTDQALANLAGPEQAGSSPAQCSNNNGTLSGDCTFDFGFPFFYGQIIFTGIDGQTLSSPTAPATPFVAY